MYIKKKVTDVFYSLVYVLVKPYKNSFSIILTPVCVTLRPRCSLKLMWHNHIVHNIEEEHRGQDRRASGRLQSCWVQKETDTERDKQVGMRVNGHRTLGLPGVLALWWKWAIGETEERGKTNKSDSEGRTVQAQYSGERGRGTGEPYNMFSL